jgi:hypothetical protein
MMFYIFSKPDTDTPSVSGRVVFYLKVFVCCPQVNGAQKRKLPKPDGADVPLANVTGLL